MDFYTRKQKATKRIQKHFEEGKTFTHARTDIVLNFAFGDKFVRTIWELLESENATSK